MTIQKMIKLKCDPRLLGSADKWLGELSPALYHDACAAHALMLAIDEAMHDIENESMPNSHTILPTIGWLADVKTRADEILTNDFGATP